MRRALVLVFAWAIVPALARAQSSACATDDATCACAETHDCWALPRIYSGRDASLGLRATLTSAPFAGAEPLQGALLTRFAVERFVTQDRVNGHVALAGAIGGGTAGAEGTLDGRIAFGYRTQASATSGAFVRGGASGSAIGNDRFALSYFEPILAEAGFQVLDAELLVEGGLTSGFVGAGHYAPPEGDADNLARSIEVGSFFTAHAGELRFDTSFTYLPAGFATTTASLTLARAELCVQPGSVLLCGGVVYANRNQSGAPQSDRPSVLHAGLTVALTP